MNTVSDSRYRRHWLALIASCLPIMAGAADTRTPVQVVTETANLVATRVEADRAHLAANPPALFALVDEIFLPVFDTDYAGRLILGRHGRSATATQRRQFIDAVYDFIVRSYSQSVLKFREDQITVLSPRAGQVNDPRRTVVRTRMRLDDGGTFQVDYSLRQTPDGWRVFDVRIEGISYVQNYRNQFDAEISARGLDAVIARLQAETLQAGSAESPSEPNDGSDGP